ncbi:hypothetical protein PZH35_06060 [Veillonella atypica]|uniref:hypothetical protein n=1 Tax=Veillonella atypica TaxID=39777 RepID=UPI0023AF06C5|nr:hypothetical protein [Veillonella atypica]MDE8713913.1 hypothetical protein [Veillonella atypica]
MDTAASAFVTAEFAVESAVLAALDTLVIAVALLSIACVAAYNWEPLIASVDVADTRPAARLVRVRLTVELPIDTVLLAESPANV